VTIELEVVATRFMRELLDSYNGLGDPKIRSTNLGGKTFAMWKERALKFQRTELVNFFLSFDKWLRSLV